MFRWSYLHPLTSFDKSYRHECSTKVGTKIWTVGRCGENKMNLFEFDTETEAMKKHEVPFDTHQFDSDCRIVSDGNVLYVWAKKYEFPTLNMKFNLFEFDTSSFAPQNVAEIDYFAKRSNITIIGSKMYLVAKNPGCELIVFDLLTKEVTQQTMKNLSDKFDGEQFTMVHDGKLHIIEYNRPRRTVYRMENGQLEQLSTDDTRCVINDRRCKEANVKFSDDMMLRQFENDFVLEAFNFETNAWNKHTIENYRLTKNNIARILSFHEVNGKLYTIFKSEDIYPSKFEMIVLEPKPALSTICLLNLADELVEENLMKIEEIKNQIPSPCRMKLVNMLNWKRNEIHRKQIRGAELKTMNRVKKRIRERHYAGYIDGKTAKKIQSEVNWVMNARSRDSDFSETIYNHDYDVGSDEDDTVSDEDGSESDDDESVSDEDESVSSEDDNVSNEDEEASD